MLNVRIADAYAAGAKERKNLPIKKMFLYAVDYLVLRKKENCNQCISSFSLEYICSFLDIFLLYDYSLSFLHLCYCLH